MNRARLTIVVVFVTAFAAGVGVGLAVRRPPPPAGLPGRGPSWMATELGLTAAQHEEMIKIWAGVGRSSWHEEGEKRQALQRQRDEAIRKLLPAESQEEFDRVHAAYARQVAEMADQRRQRFDSAVTRSKAILAPEQRTKYEAILSRRAEGRDGRRPGPGGYERPENASTRPGSATTPAMAPPASSAEPARVPGAASTPASAPAAPEAER